MNEQECAAALAFADDIERGNFVIGVHVEDSVMPEPVHETTKAELVALLRRAYARPAPADLVEAVAEEVRGQAVPGWQSIKTASKDREIVALSPGYKGPIVLRWFKYDGREAWRDWDGDPHDPTLWFDLPPAEQKASVPDEAAIRADEREWLLWGTAPEDGTEVLVYRPDAGVFTAQFVESDWYLSDMMRPPEGDASRFSTSGYDLDGDLPTHWMPLPAAPKPEDKP